MEANLKLEEAEYFLAKLKQEYVTDATDVGEITKEFAHNLSAFISAWRSVWDVLRYDFAEKYLKVSRDKELRWNEFKKISAQNQDVIPVVKWLESKFDILKENPLWEIRHHNIHRGMIDIDREQRPYPINGISGSPTVSNVIRRKSKPNTSASSRGQKLRFVFRLGQSHDIEHKQIVLTCDVAFKLMQSIVNEASEKI